MVKVEVRNDQGVINVYVTDGLREFGRSVTTKAQIPEMVKILLGEYNHARNNEKKLQKELEELQTIAETALKVLQNGA